jgi:hypothetical protein
MHHASGDQNCTVCSRIGARILPKGFTAACASEPPSPHSVQPASLEPRPLGIAIHGTTGPMGLRRALASGILATGSLGQRL